MVYFFRLIYKLSDSLKSTFLHVLVQLNYNNKIVLLKLKSLPKLRMKNRYVKPT